jgi:hypothetical protein
LVLYVGLWAIGFYVGRKLDSPEASFPDTTVEIQDMNRKT